MCFVAGTPVWVAVQDKSGQWQSVSKPIETVKAGEYVIARNEQTGKTSVRRVLKTTIKHTHVTVSVTLADKSGQTVETITASREHPFYVDGKGFVPAGGLAIGNSIVTRAGPSLVVKAIQWNRRAEGYAVYNFVVEEEHTYFVGLANGGAWVHNPPLWCGNHRTQVGDVGRYNDLSTASDAGDALEIHHVPQYAHANNLGVPGYTYAGAPSIAIDELGYSASL